MVISEHFRRYASHGMAGLVLVALLCSPIVVKQPDGISTRLRQRQLDLHTAEGGYADDFLDTNSSFSQHLQPRGDYDGWAAKAAASDDEYEIAKKRGELLLCWLDHPGEVPEDKASSPWTNYDQLKEWGWEDRSRPHNGGETDAGLKKIFEESDLETWTNEDWKVIFEHNGEHPADGNTRYPPTQAKYENFVYPRHGLLVAEYNYGPDNKIASKLRKKEWDSSTMSRPKLYQLSDVMWLGWAKYSSPENLSNLKEVAIHNIGNEPTVRILAKVMKKVDPAKGPSSLGIAPLWDDGIEFKPGSPDFAALLGSQGVWALPYMLIQRSGSKGLGKQLTIERMVVFTAKMNKYYQDPTIMIYLKDLKQKRA